MKIIKKNIISLQSPRSPPIFAAQNGAPKMNAQPRKSPCSNDANDIESLPLEGSGLEDGANTVWWQKHLTRPGGPFPGGIPWFPNKPFDQQDPKLINFVNDMKNRYGKVTPIDFNIDSAAALVEYFRKLSAGETTRGGSPMYDEWCAEYFKEITNVQTKAKEDCNKNCIRNGKKANCREVKKNGQWGSPGICGGKCVDRTTYICDECVSVKDCTSDKDQEKCWDCSSDDIKNSPRSCNQKDPLPEGCEPTPPPSYNVNMLFVTPTPYKGLIHE